MALKRVIPCLDVDAGRVVKGTNFVGLRDAARWLRIWRGRRGKRLMEPDGSLAAWAADMELLGKRRTVNREMQGALRRGWIDRGFLRRLDRFLKSTGYRR